MPKPTTRRTVASYKSENKPTWCPGCGDFGVLSGLYKALVALELDSKDIVLVSGIGCSGRLPEFVNAYGLHVVHGRALPTAMGVKLANPNLTVLAVGGDGDGFAIGGGHVPHAVRRNVDITYIVMDNEVYGLTKGQPSPTTPAGLSALKMSQMMVKMAPYAGIIEMPLNIMAMVLTYGASFIARGFSGQPIMLTDLYIEAIQHKGFSFIHALSPCPTFYNTYDSWKQLVTPLPENFDTTDRAEAIRLALTEDVFHLGVFHKQEWPTMEEMVGTVKTTARGDQEVTLEKLFDLYA
ncbi:MAG: 2-oxoacid:ferredoxin oxidoreductase subunit beta [Candidatus Latescibacteria bacterium]|nr:2-oxoacid:ferredoxin oxidoreductase subunit beta [Candidatus Latescibacterota bacterium]